MPATLWHPRKEFGWLNEDFIKNVFTFAKNISYDIFTKVSSSTNSYSVGRFHHFRFYHFAFPFARLLPHGHMQSALRFCVVFHLWKGMDGRADTLRRLFRFKRPCVVAYLWHRVFILPDILPRRILAERLFLCGFFRFHLAYVTPVCGQERGFAGFVRHALLLVFYHLPRRSAC